MQSVGFPPPLRRHRRAAGFDDLIGHATLVCRIAFHSLDQVRDQGVALLEMDVDIAKAWLTH